MRSRILLSSIIGACLAAAPAVASAQRGLHSEHVYRADDYPRYHYHYDFGARADGDRIRAFARAGRAEARAESRAVQRAVQRAEQREYATRRRLDRDFRRRDLSMRIRDRIEASRTRSKYRW